MSHKITLIKSTTKCLFIDLREAKKEGIFYFITCKSVSIYLEEIRRKFSKKETNKISDNFLKKKKEKHLCL